MEYTLYISEVKKNRNDFIESFESWLNLSKTKFDLHILIFMYSINMVASLQEYD